MIALPYTPLYSLIPLLYSPILPYAPLIPLLYPSYTPLYNRVVSINALLWHSHPYHFNSRVLAREEIFLVLFLSV